MWREFTCLHLLWPDMSKIHVHQPHHHHHHQQQHHQWYWATWQQECLESMNDNKTDHHHHHRIFEPFTSCTLCCTIFWPQNYSKIFRCHPLLSKPPWHSSGIQPGAFGTHGADPSKSLTLSLALIITCFIESPSTVNLDMRKKCRNTSGTPKSTKTKRTRESRKQSCNLPRITACI